MRLAINISHLQIPEERQIAVLHNIIGNADRYFLQDGLRKYDIPGRTKIYKLFGWSYNYMNTDAWEMERETRHTRQVEAIREILRHSDFRDWVKNYMLYYNLNNALNMFAQAEVDLTGFDIRVERETANVVS